MTKKKKIKILKIVSVFVWIVLLLAPILTAQIEDVTMTSRDLTYNFNTGKYECSITCDKSFVSGTVKIAFYDADNNYIETLEKSFDDNEGKTALVIIESSELPDEMEYYKIEELRVTTDTQETISAVCYLFAIVLAVALIFILRLVVLEYQLDGKQIEVYAGVIKKTLRVNGELVASTKKASLFKPITLVARVGEKDIIAEIKANNKIVLYSKDIAQKSETPEETKTAYEMTVEEKEFFEKMEEEVIIQKKTEKDSAEPENTATIESETAKILEVEEPAETVVDKPDGNQEEIIIETKTTDIEADDINKK